MTNKQVINMLLKLNKFLKYDTKNLIIYNNYSFIKFKNEYEFNLALLSIEYKTKIDDDNLIQALLNFINDLYLNEKFEYKTINENKTNYAFIDNTDYYFLVLNKSILKENLSINYINKSFSFENDKLTFVCMLSKKF